MAVQLENDVHRGGMWCMQRKESDHPGRSQSMATLAENPVTGTVSVTRQEQLGVSGSA